METNAVTLRYINIHSYCSERQWRLKGFSLLFFSTNKDKCMCACVTLCVCVSLCVCMSVRHCAKSCHINCKQLGSVEPSTKQTPKAVMRQADKKIETASEEGKEAQKDRERHRERGGVRSRESTAVECSMPQMKWQRLTVTCEEIVAAF